MKRSFPKVALLLLPIAVVIALLPVLRRTADVRVEKIEEIRPTRINIVSCELQKPTTWEAFRGADTTLVARIVEPKALGSGLVTRVFVEISDQAGRKWLMNGPPVKDVAPGSFVAASREEEFAEATALRMGLKWSAIVGKNGAIDAKITKQFLKDSDSEKVVHGTSRTFSLSQPVAAAPLASLRVSNYTLRKVTLQTVRDGNRLMRTLSLTVRVPQLPPASVPNSGRAGFFEIRLNTGEKLDVTDLGSVTSQTDARGDAIIKMDFADDSPRYRAKPASTGGLFSFDNGWPQDVQIKLPQGLPATPGTIILPFKTTLAPLPKPPKVGAKSSP